MSFDGNGTENGTFAHGTFTGSFDPRCFAETCLHVPQLAVFSDCQDDAEQVDQSVANGLPLPAEMLTLFEQITGWVVAIDETPMNNQWRQVEAESRPLSDFEDDIPTVVQTAHQSASRSAARFALTTRDISTDWPAGRPTGHRVKCDQFLALLKDLVAELHDVKCELTRVQSSLAAIDPTAFCDDHEAILIDSFIPQWPAERDPGLRGTDRSDVDLRVADRRVTERRDAERRITVSRRSNDQAFSQSEDDFVLIDFNESIDLEILIELNKLKSENE